MYKFSVAFFVLLFSITTFVAAAPDGPYIAKRTDGNQKVYFRKRDPGAGNTALQKQVLRGAIKEYCTVHHDACMRAIGTESLQQFEDGSMGGGAPSNKAERMKVLQAAMTSYCSKHHDECLAAIGRTGSITQLEQGAVAGA